MTREVVVSWIHKFCPIRAEQSKPLSPFSQLLQNYLRKNNGYLLRGAFLFHLEKKSTEDDFEFFEETLGKWVLQRSLPNFISVEINLISVYFTSKIVSFIIESLNLKT